MAPPPDQDDKGSAAAEPDSHKPPHPYQLTSRCLGAGLNGRVFLASHRETHDLLAVKPFSLEGLDKGRMRDMCREINVHKSFDHPNIAKAIDAFIDEEQVHLVMEYLEGGDVLKHVMDQGKLGERKTRCLIKQVLQAVRYLHRRGVVHRDIKPENMAFENDSREKVKLIDFGLCREWRAGDQKMYRVCGTEAYMAPEVFNGTGYTSKVDMWSLGISIHVMLTGKTIGWGADSTPLLSRALEMCSWNAQQFVAALVCTDPSVRPSAVEALRHPWMRNADVGGQPDGLPTAGTCEGTNPAFTFSCARAPREPSGDFLSEDLEPPRKSSSAWAPSRLMRLLQSTLRTRSARASSSWRTTSSRARTMATARGEPATQVSPPPSPASSPPEGIPKAIPKALETEVAQVSTRCSTDLDSPCKIGTPSPFDALATAAAAEKLSMAKVDMLDRHARPAFVSYMSFPCKMSL